MGNFYDDWLHYWDDEQEERAKARTCIQEEELEWVRTKQDYRAALLCTRENGFITSGVTMVAEIPEGWNTGKHCHGEEAIYILEGEGFSVVDGKRYDWAAGSTLFMPFWSVHQHFNLGKGEVRYYSATAIALERFAGLAKIIQYEEARETPMGEVEGFEKAESDIHPDPEYGRIVLRAEDARITVGGEEGRSVAAMGDERRGEFARSTPKEMRAPGAPGHHGRVIHFMGGTESGFKAREVEMTGFLCDGPGKHGGRHAHMEAVLYVVEGEGYSMVGGVKVPWKKGTCFQVQGPQVVHQHFNTGKTESKLLRTHFGLRSQFFQYIARRAFPYLYFEYRSQ